METVVTALVDEFPTLRKKKTYIMLAACAIGYLLGFTCITKVCIKPVYAGNIFFSCPPCGIVFSEKSETISSH